MNDEQFQTLCALLTRIYVAVENNHKPLNAAAQWQWHLLGGPANEQSQQQGQYPQQSSGCMCGGLGCAGHCAQKQGQ